MGPQQATEFLAAGLGSANLSMPAPQSSLILPVHVMNCPVGCGWCGVWSCSIPRVCRGSFGPWLSAFCGAVWVDFSGNLINGLSHAFSLIPRGFKLGRSSAMLAWCMHAYAGTLPALGEYSVRTTQGVVYQSVPQFAWTQVDLSNNPYLSGTIPDQVCL